MSHCMLLGNHISCFALYGQIAFIIVFHCMLLVSISCFEVYLFSLVSMQTQIISQICKVHLSRFLLHIRGINATILCSMCHYFCRSDFLYSFFLISSDPTLFLFLFQHSFLQRLQHQNFPLRTYNKGKTLDVITVTR